MGKKLIIFTDIGDTIIDESTEERNALHVVQRARCIPGARETTLRLHEAGYPIVMVADGMTRSFHNLMDLHGLSPVFSAWVISAVSVISRLMESVERPYRRISSSSLSASFGSRS